MSHRDYQCDCFLIEDRDKSVILHYYIGKIYFFRSATTPWTQAKHQ